MTNEIVPAQAGGVQVTMRVDGLAEMGKLAEMLAKAPPGAVPEALARNPEAIFAVLATAAEMRIGPMEGLRGIYMVKGKPQLSASLMLAQALRAGIRIQWLVSTTTQAKARFTRPGYPEHEESFTLEDAKLAGLLGSQTWKSYPLAMLRARTISRALTGWAPDVLGAGIYVEGEIEPNAPDEVVTVESIVEPEAESAADAVARLIAACESSQTPDELDAVREERSRVWGRMNQEQREALATAGRAANARIEAAMAQKARRARGDGDPDGGESRAYRAARALGVDPDASESEALGYTPGDQ